MLASMCIFTWRWRNFPRPWNNLGYSFVVWSAVRVSSSALIAATVIRISPSSLAVS